MHHLTARDTKIINHPTDNTPENHAKPQRRKGFRSWRLCGFACHTLGCFIFRQSPRSLPKGKIIVWVFPAMVRAYTQPATKVRRAYDKCAASTVLYILNTSMYNAAMYTRVSSERRVKSWRKDLIAASSTPKLARICHIILKSPPSLPVYH
jgi:hypothetical protein